MGPRAGLDGCGKSHPPGFDPLTVQPVASRYTDWAIPAHCSIEQLLLLHVLISSRIMSPGLRLVRRYIATS